MSSPLLPMFKAKINARAAHPVGNYALRIDFNDGHSTGIYSFDYLRTICRCEACAREFRTAPDLSSRNAAPVDTGPSTVKDKYGPS